MSKRINNGNRKYGMWAALITAAALVVFSFGFAFTSAKYVTEIDNGDDSFSYETQTPCFVGSQQDLFNAIKSGYGYVKLADNLKTPIIMTGDALDLKRDLTIDLNGNEIERNNRDSLLNVSTGKTFTVIDSKGGGGLYNPIGSVLTVSGGDLNVFGGMFESGPRPSEYYTLLRNGSYSLDFGAVEKVDTNSSDAVSYDPSRMPRLPIRKTSAATGSGNVYFDTAVIDGGSTLIKRDTYCYVAVEGEPGEGFGTYDVQKAGFAYMYYVDGNGIPTDDAETGTKVMLFGYENDIEYSMGNAPGGKTVPIPNYAAVSMSAGRLNINVISDTSDSPSARASTTGSFYSYFGTWHTSCVYMTGGQMTVSTTGELKTVDPDELPAIVSGDTASNSAKFSESACVICDGGTIDFERCDSATSYNGSVVSVSGGEVNMREVNISKNATLSHADSPFDIADDENGEFPRGRQYRDAALFINGGALTVSQNSTITVNKDIEAGIADKRTDGAYKTTFGILSRGRTASETASSLVCTDTDIKMHGDHSYAVFGTRGRIEFTGGSIDLDSDSYCYGVYAVNKSSETGHAVDIELTGTHITLWNKNAYKAGGNDIDTELGKYTGRTPVSDWVNADGTPVAAGTVGAMRAASIGVYLDSSAMTGGKITMNGANVISQEMGVAVNAGNLTFKNGSSIAAYNASAICLNSGTILFENNSGKTGVENVDRYTIINYINRKSDGNDSVCMADDTTAIEAGSHQYNIYLPWQRTVNGNTVSITKYENCNGIRVIGGELKAEGLLDVTFRGLYNDFDYYKTSGTFVNYDKVKIKSFAVACLQQSGDKDINSAAFIDIKYADIKVSVGGGVKVENGSVVLGRPREDGKDVAQPNDIRISTNGRVHGETLYTVASTAAYATWRFYPNLSGGYVAVARGGTMTIYNGTYTAEFCDGIAVTNDDPAQKATVNIYNGTFTGKLGHIGTPGHDTAAGPASHYGFKVMGGSSVNIYNGMFDGKNGGGIVRGSSRNNKAAVKLYAGTFGTEKSQDGFNIYEYSDVTFGAYSEAELNSLYPTQEARQGALRFTAYLFPIAVNPISAKETVPPDEIVTGSANGQQFVRGFVNVEVNYGTYMITHPDRTNLGIGVIDYTMSDVSFTINSVGKNVYDQDRGGWINEYRIRGGNHTYWDDALGKNVEAYNPNVKVALNRD